MIYRFVNSRDLGPISRVRVELHIWDLRKDVKGIFHPTELNFSPSQIIPVIITMGRPTESAGSTNSLTVRDNRTGKVYDVPYVAWLLCRRC